MISVIVPVYNVEPYLRKCLDSIIEQTYRDLEILVIDDGCTDGSGLICDDYAEQDARVRVFHTDNHGLSAARNLGLENARGEYIGFVDSDDWIEPDMYEVLYSYANKTQSDAACCGYYRQYAKTATEHALTGKEICYEGKGLIPAIMKGYVFGHYAWNKIYKKELFTDCSFPEGKYFEDIATTWRVLLKCHRVICVRNILYHYTIRKDSIGNTKNMKNFVDRWCAFCERYEVMSPKSEELQQICTKGCLDTIGYAWRWLYVVDKKDREKYWNDLQEMRQFAKDNRDSIKSTSVSTRISLFCAIHSNPLLIFGCYCLNQVYRRIRGINHMVEVKNV